MGLPGGAVEEISQRRVEVHLEQDRHGEEHDHQRLTEDLLSLKSEQQHKGAQERNKAERTEPAQRRGESRLTATREQRPAQDLRNHHRHDDVETDREKQRVPRHANRREAE